MSLPILAGSKVGTPCKVTRKKHGEEFLIFRDRFSIILYDIPEIGGHGHLKNQDRGHGRGHGHEFFEKSRTRTRGGRAADLRVHRSLTGRIKKSGHK